MLTDKNDILTLTCSKCDRILTLSSHSSLPSYLLKCTCGGLYVTGEVSRAMYKGEPKVKVYKNESR